MKYEFRFDGKSQVIIFAVKEGMLMANLEGRITKCLGSIPAMGVKAEGTRIKDSP